MSAPASPTAEVWPVWHDLIDNWRATDAHWLRDRVVNLFDDATARTNSGIAPLAGTLSYLQGTDSLEMYKSSGGWESVRYPNLAVTSDSTTVQLRRTGAGSGIILDSAGAANVEKLNAGLGTLVVGSTGAAFHTGVAGNKTAVLATDTTALTIDSPVKITGALSATGAFSAPSVALTGAATAASVTATGQVQGATVVATGQSSGATGLFGTIALASNQSSWASFAHNSQPSRGFQAGSAGDTQVIGTSINLSGPVTASSMNVSGSLVATGGGNLGAAGFGVLLGGLIVVGRAPTSGDTHPNGTIWVQV